MPFVAVLNSRSSLEALVQRGESPAAVATWSSAVVAGARTHGIPVISEDELLTEAERRGIPNLKTVEDVLAHVFAPSGALWLEC